MTFSSREAAGRELGQLLVERGIAVDLVLGLPRGGVTVAAQIARLLRVPFDVLVVRKLGHPRHREFAVGALAEPDVVLMDHLAMKESHVNQAELEAVIAEEQGRLHDYQTRFHPAGLPVFDDKRVLIVDDGMATGATMEAAVMSAKQQHAARVLVAVPTASPNAADRLSRVADDFIALIVDPDFMAVGQYYETFPQITDEQVLELLPAHV